jgi:transcription antitermination factor NusG
MQIGLKSSKGDAAPSAWFALYTRHQHEKNVAALLSRKQFEVFLPLYEARHRWKDRVKRLSLPLFPSYVFLRGGIERQLQILTTPGVFGIVTAGDRVAPIPSEEIEAVRLMVENSLRVEPHPFLKCGDWVRVKVGPLEGVEGILVRMKGVSRLIVSVEMLQKSVAVEVYASDVERTRRSETRETKVPARPGAADLAMGLGSRVPSYGVNT